MIDANTTILKVWENLAAMKGSSAIVALRNRSDEAVLLAYLTIDPEKAKKAEAVLDEFDESFSEEKSMGFSTLTWIDSAQELPDDETTVLVETEDGEVCVGYHEGTAWRFGNHLPSNLGGDEFDPLVPLPVVAWAHLQKRRGPS